MDVLTGSRLQLRKMHRYMYTDELQIAIPRATMSLEVEKLASESPAASGRGVGSGQWDESLRNRREPQAARHRSSGLATSCGYGGAVRMLAPDLPHPGRRRGGGVEWVPPP